MNGKLAEFGTGKHKKIKSKGYNLANKIVEILNERMAQY
jgi:hypothetical protein